MATLIHIVRWFLGVVLVFVGLGMIKHGWTPGWARLRSVAWTLGGILVGTLGDLLLP